MNTLDPVLADYRRAAREGDLPACLASLRRLASLDPDNPVWKEDLSRFERRRLQDLRRVADKAIPAGDLAALESLIRELDGPLAATRDDALRAELTAALRAGYGRQAIEQARGALANMATAYAAHDFTRADTYARQYQQLLTSEYFKPDPEMARQFDEAFRWLEEQRRLRNEHQRIDAQLAELRAELDRGPRGRRLETLWHALTRAGTPVDPELARRALDALAIRREARRRRRTVAAAAAAAALLLLGLAALALHSRRAAERDLGQWLGQLDQAAAREDLAAFDALLELRRRHRPSDLETAETRQRLAARPALEQAARARAQALRDTLDRLEALLDRESERPPLAEAEELLARAETGRLAAAPEDADRLARLRPRVLALAAGIRQPADQALGALLDQLAAGLARVAGLASSSMDRASADLPGLRALLGRARGLEDATPALREQASLYAARLADLEQALAARQKQWLAIARSASLPDYLAALQTYARAFPGDAVSRDLADLAGHRQVYEHLTALAGRAATNADFAGEDFLLESAGLPADTLFWQPALAQLAAQDRLLQERWPAARQAILGYAANSNLTDLSAFEEARPAATGFQVTARGYLLGRFRKETAGPADAVVAVSGEVYLPRPEDLQPEFRLQRFQGDGSGRIQIRPEPLPHCAFVKTLISDARWVAPGSADILLALKLDELAALTNASALFRARLADQLLTLFAGLQADPLPPAWARAQRDLAALDPALSWLCDLNPEVVKANAHAEAVLDRHFRSGRLGRQYALDGLIARAAVSRGLRWVGYASFEDPPRPILTTPRRPGELWVVTAVPSGVPELAVAAELPGDDIRTEWPLEPGALLFAPDDGRTTADCLRLIRNKTGLAKPAAPTLWPAAWPVNRR